MKTIFVFKRSHTRYRLCESIITLSTGLLKCTYVLSGQIGLICLANLLISVTDLDFKTLHNVNKDFSPIRETRFVMLFLTYTESF